MFQFKILTRDSKSRARLGILTTPHGLIHTPAFVPVATKGALRGLSFDAAAQYGAEVFMVNTFHFFHNERYKTVAREKGLHKFLKTEKPFMTDSGGFQVFSLGFGSEHGVGKIADIFPDEGRKIHSTWKGKNFVKIRERGALFTSPYDGRALELTPELSVRTQEKLGADIIFAFDECTSPLAGYRYTKKALERTHRWALRCLKTFRGNNQALFGIVQGGAYRNLREESARVIGSLPFFGFGIGGSLGKSKRDMYRVLDWVIPLLPELKPKHLLGIGEVDDILEAVRRGVDIFDCVIPTRWARHGAAMTFQGRIDMRHKKHLRNRGPIDQKCPCRVCRVHSRSYIAHLIREKEIFGIMLLAEHNVAWILHLMQQLRYRLAHGKF